ncbi:MULTISPECIES: DUF4255 domain-containing protein [Photorhabdus]|uniref:Pvc16 N-terminal domain-containing protein n=2 Tax=Photorhabdus asymbiotica TaxID=291112 RepID=B6VNM9_PHOAA|nr:DUF4255 domain-containing protein [Photorhabdus asymbiotica]6J0F_A Chain A, Pvc16 [Photorhabdus asymbiotica subsp. asymbiotica ATCC 43949]6J0F_B Chain B, Pvc16 [Photorhabdus asymbiotica subsp. asymbiotica ATCC 43949]6J0F_C Chain C, Pvc16 [Photorhabdus asymbiotica subsp. asymbiotica ATCC 43949]6J0F_D Chain D, Pvc16 [Photorhabdus asymbiotica subsp. asymbiotica ATCC 43949]6J0F_E Chain E, Pvc16 [Photorhabdus asymbiotica subsp. asymbiotica ATCC 43949]6J0F_F Chain F, Pvc16 [Photorhabdus asymbiot
MLNTQTIIDVNKAMDAMLRAYLNQDIAIRFDLPELDTMQSDAMVSIFLYDIHEDLQLRSAESRGFDVYAGRLLPGWVNIKCNYLITYWEASKPATDASSPDSQPDNQAIQVMSQVLNALINNRQLAGIPGAYTQVVPPKESLNSLGNFWQSLGNRPRLSLNYSVTVPVSLNDGQDSATPVTAVSSTVEQTASLSQEVVSHALRELLITELGGGEDNRLVLSKVELSAVKETMTQDSPAQMIILLSVSGITRQEYLKEIDNIFDRWVNNAEVITTIDDCGIRIESITKDNLVGI